LTLAKFGDQQLRLAEAGESPKMVDLKPLPTLVVENFLGNSFIFLIYLFHNFYFIYVETIGWGPKGQAIEYFPRLLQIIELYRETQPLFIEKCSKVCNYLRILIF